MDQVAQTQLCYWANQMDRPTVGDNVIYYTRVSPAVTCEAWAEQMQIDWPTVGDGEGYTPVLRRPWWPLLQCRPCVNIQVVLSCYSRVRIGLVPASSEVDSVVMFMTLISIYIYAATIFYWYVAAILMRGASVLLASEFHGCSRGFCPCSLSACTSQTLIYPSEPAWSK